MVPLMAVSAEDDLRDEDDGDPVQGGLGIADERRDQQTDGDAVEGG